MFVPFHELPSTSRIWIYQSSKKFTLEEINILSGRLSTFTQTWVTHGNPMKASFQLPYDHFIILAADEHYNAPSGCSIDDSIRTIKSLSEELKLDFFDRTGIAFREENDIKLIPLDKLKNAFSAGEWNRATPVFNNLLTTKSQLADWLVPAGTTWLKRYLSPESVAN